ncbi:hypothetical protein L873DRAFT_1801112 [Choiromyces venosus 120613-1]|uniref:Uncharacterized protein n=1 Tax=Choiromyces venosus 120613-1 TaxID=1336337 RepID=A0A3N4JXE4_9PEZI|nr:hypothetical protein L873DRAFT_1801112 [Choiromyces venosus 120613-1]
MGGHSGLCPNSGAHCQQWHGAPLGGQHSEREAVYRVSRFFAERCSKKALEDFGRPGPGCFAGPRAVRLWFDIPSEFRPDGPLPSGLDKVQWQTRRAVSWLELTEPTLSHLLLQIGRVVVRGVGYRHLIGATWYGTILLLDNPEEPLPISEMIPILSSRHVRIWWGFSPPNEPMDLLFRCHRDPGESGTPPPHGQPYGNRNNRGPPEEEEVEEEQEEEEQEEQEEEEGGQGGGEDDDDDDDAVRWPGGEDDDDDDDSVRRPGNKKKTRPPSQVDSKTRILRSGRRILAAVIGNAD